MLSKEYFCSFPPALKSEREFNLKMVFLRICPHGLRSVCWGICGVLLAAGLLHLTRQYQVVVLNKLFQQYTDSPMEELSFVRLKKKSNRVLLKIPDLQGSRPEFLAVTIQWKDSQYDAIHLVLRYKDGNTKQALGTPAKIDWFRRDWSRTVNLFRPLGIPAPQTRLYFTAWPPFEGIEVVTDQSEMVQSIHRVKNPEKLPALLTVCLPATPSGVPLYQRLELETDGLYVYPYGITGATASQLITSCREEIASQEIAYHHHILRVGANSWIVKGYAQPGVDVNSQPTRDRSLSSVSKVFAADVSVNQIDTDLLITKPKFIPKGSYFLANGNLLSGGLSLGLIRNGNNAGSFEITRKGSFTAIIKVSEDGRYSVGVTNHLQWYSSLENFFVISRPGWLIKNENL